MMTATQVNAEPPPGERKGKVFFVPNEMLDLWGPKIGGDGFAVYCALSRFADNETRSCYPSVTTLARLLGYGERTVQRLLDRLEQVGLISRVRRKLPGKNAYTSSLYTLLPLPDADPSDTGGGVTQTPGVVSHRHPNNTQYNNTQRTSNFSDGPAVAGAAGAAAPGLPRQEKVKSRARSKDSRTPEEVTARKALEARLRPVKAEIKAAYVECVGIEPFEDPHKLNAAIKYIAETGFTADDVRRCYRAMKLEDFWKARDLSLSQVAKRLPAFLQSSNQPLPAGRTPEAQAKAPRAAENPRKFSAYSQDFKGHER